MDACYGDDGDIVHFPFQVTFHVDELRRVTGGVNTTVGNNTGSLVIGNTF